MRLQLALLAVAIILVDWCSAFVIQNNTLSKVNDDSANKVNSKLPDDKPEVELLNHNKLQVFSPVFRSVSNSYSGAMQPQFDPSSLKRFSIVPLRGFFAFRNPQSGSGPVQYRSELMNATTLNCSEDSTNCRDRHTPRQISKRMTMASGIPNRRTRRPYDVPQIGKSFIFSLIIRDENLPWNSDFPILIIFTKSTFKKYFLSLYLQEFF